MCIRDSHDCCHHHADKRDTEGQWLTKMGRRAAGNNPDDDDLSIVVGIAIVILGPSGGGCCGPVGPDPQGGGGPGLMPRTHSQNLLA